MNTFLPFPNFAKSAKSLDYRRLGKQRVEAYQILRTLLGQSIAWIHHPVTKMWCGYEFSLNSYGTIVCCEWIDRGYQDTLLDKFITFQVELPQTGRPPWFGNEDFHRSHRANLVRKYPEYYVPLFGQLEPEPYVWPAS